MSGCGRRHRAKFLTRQFLNPTAWTQLKENEQLGLCIEAPYGGQVRLFIFHPFHVKGEEWKIKSADALSPSFALPPSSLPSSSVTLSSSSSSPSTISPCLPAEFGSTDLSLKPCGKCVRSAESNGDEVSRLALPCDREGGQSRRHSCEVEVHDCVVRENSTILLSPSKGDLLHSLPSPSSPSLPQSTKSLGEERSLHSHDDNDVHDNNNNSKVEEVTNPTGFRAESIDSRYGYVQKVVLPRKFHKVIWLAVKDVVVIVHQDEIKMKLSPDQLKAYMKLPQFTQYYKEAVEECKKGIDKARQEGGGGSKVGSAGQRMFVSPSFPSSAAGEAAQSPSAGVPPQEEEISAHVDTIKEKEEAQEEEEDNDEEDGFIMRNMNYRKNRRLMYFYEEQEEEEENF